VLLYIPGLTIVASLWDQGEGDLIYIVAWLAASLGIFGGVFAGWIDQRGKRMRAGQLPT